MAEPENSNGIGERISVIAAEDLRDGIKAKFAADPDRSSKFQFSLSDAIFDFSKTHVSDPLLDLYDGFAAKVGFDERRKQLFRGEKINVTESRAVLHPLLRDPNNHDIELVSPSLAEEAKIAQHDLARCYKSISEQLGARQQAVRDIIHIGIGGSSLGTQLLWQALRPLSSEIQIHFVGNIDGHELTAVLAQCQPESTLVVGVSKTFTTAETLKNIRSVKKWFEGSTATDFWQSFYAVTAEQENATAFGALPQNTVSFPRWVGGRYSVWSAVSLSAVIALGIETFEQFLHGAADYDSSFLALPNRRNPSFVAAALDHYYINYFNAGSRAIFAYDYRLRSLVDYLQQLETESNGKDRLLNGDPVDQKTSAVIWGGVGTNVQHSVFQMLHQGTNIIPAEFILVAKPTHDLLDHHRELLANGLAQPAALLAGQSLEQVRRSKPKDFPDALAKSKVFTGDRPSTTVLLNELTPYTLGSLLAFNEHRTFCFGVLCGVNSFDQMGVELGKRLAKTVEPKLHTSKVASLDENSATLNTEGDALDPSTDALLQHVKSQLEAS